MKTAEDFMADHLGQTVKTVARLQAANEQVREQSEATLSTLYECVASGQVDESGTAKLLADPLFSAYYAERTKQ